jgi:hypothetical protein
MTPLAIALAVMPDRREVASGFWHCLACGFEKRLTADDASAVEYTGWWGIGSPPYIVPDHCDQKMVIDVRPLTPRAEQPEPKTKYLSRAEMKARYTAQQAVDTKSDAEHSLDEARARLLPWGDKEYVGKPLSELPHFVLEKAKAWASAKKRAGRFTSLVRDIDLVLANPGSFEDFPKAIDREDDDIFAFTESKE